MGPCTWMWRTASSRSDCSLPSRRCSPSRRLLRIPYPILLVLGGLALGVIPGMPTIELEPELIFFGVLPPLAVQRRVLHLAPRPEGERSPDRAPRDRPRRDDDRRCRGRRARADRRVDVAERLRARRDRLADRSDRGDRDRPPAGRAAATGVGRRGREPRQRRHGPGPLPGRRRLRSSPARSRQLGHRRPLPRERAWRSRGRARRRLDRPPDPPPSRQPTGGAHDLPA